MGVSLRSCPQGRRATGYAIASVLRFATHWAIARPPHASRRKNTLNTFIQSLIFYMPHNQIKTR
ncbi:MAG: hypothetical protein NZ455_12960 [Bacteroidia bacterium]|nr:hypothetical protein [Bacteroidia bacterium]